MFQVDDLFDGDNNINFAKYCSWYGWTLSSNKITWFNDDEDLPELTTQELYTKYRERDRIFKKSKSLFSKVLSYIIT